MGLEAEAAAYAVVAFLVAAGPILLFVLTACLLMRSIAGRYTARFLIFLIVTAFSNGSLGLLYFSLSGDPAELGGDMAALGRIVRELDPLIVRDMLYGSHLALATALVIYYVKRAFARHIRDADDDMIST